MFWDATLLRRSHRHRGGSAGRALVLRGSGAGLLRHLRARDERESASRTDVTVTFLREGETPVVKMIPVGASSRATIGAGDYPELAGRSFGLIVDATQPVIAERSMYFGSTPTRAVDGRSRVARRRRRPRPRGSTRKARPARSSTRSSCSAIPATISAKVTLDFLLESGETVSVQRDVPARRTRHGGARIGRRSAACSTGAVSTVVTSDRPIVSERSHLLERRRAAVGRGSQQLRPDADRHVMGLAEGRVGGTHQFATYILLAESVGDGNGGRCSRDLSARERHACREDVSGCSPRAATRSTRGTVPELQNRVVRREDLRDQRRADRRRTIDVLECERRVLGRRLARAGPETSP